MKVFFLYLDGVAAVAVFHRCHCVVSAFGRWHHTFIFPNLICLQQGVPSSGTSGNLTKASSYMSVLVIHSVFLTYDTHVSSHFFHCLLCLPLHRWEIPHPLFWVIFRLLLIFMQYICGLSWQLKRSFLSLMICGFWQTVS